MSADYRENHGFIEDIFPFNLLDQSSQQRISSLFERVSYSAGTVIFKEGDPADTLYFVLSGTVRLSYRKRNRNLTMGCLSAGDHFGEDALNRNAIYRTSAKCENRVVLLRLAQEDIQTIFSEYAIVRKAFYLIDKTYRMTRSKIFPWKNKNENIVLISRRHPLFLLTRIFLVGGLGVLVAVILFIASLSAAENTGIYQTISILFLLFGILTGGWAGYEWTNDYFIITHDRVLVQKKTLGFYESRQEAPISAILSSGITQTVWGRTFGFGTVSLQSYNGELNFHRLPYTYLIYELLENHRLHVQRAAKREEQVGIQDTLKRRMAGDFDPNATNAFDLKPPSENQAYQGGSISDLLARFFNLRYEKEGSIVYRTHWWILIKKTTLAGLLLLAAVLAVIGRVAGWYTVISESLVYSIGLIAAVIAWGWWLFQYQDWHNDIYIVTRDQLIDVNRKPLGTEIRRSAPIKNIQTVEYTRKGLIGLILNFGTVKIQIGNEELTFDDVYFPSQVQAEVYQKFKEFSDSVKRNEQQRMADWIKTYDEIKQEKPVNNHPTHP